MITWMQKHKKWLVITIWISAIAFIGAGMVNWGSYGFGLSNDKVARVGDRDIRMPDYQRTYYAVLREYSQIPQLGGILDEAQAKQLGIPQIALSRAIQQAQLLHFADDLGLSISDEEVSKELINSVGFTDENGYFSLDVYDAYLKDSQMEKSEFEERVRDSLLIQKLFSLMNANTMTPLSNTTAIEEKSLQMAYAVRDRLKLKRITMNEVNISFDDAELMAFWEANANNWKTPMAFEIAYVFVPFTAQKPSDDALKEHYENFKSDYLDEQGSLLSMEQSMPKLLADVQKVEAESAAKREYRDLKNGTKEGTIRTIKEDERFFIQNGTDWVVADLSIAQEGQVLKPIEVDNGFVTLKLLRKHDSVIKSFEEAKDAARIQYIHNKKKDTLIALAIKERGSDFKGVDIGFVDRFYKGDILTLNDSQKMHFLNQVFSQQSLSGYVLFDDEVIIYRILEQTYSPLNAKDSDDVVNLAKNIKFEAIFDAFAEYLNKTYKTTIYIDVSK